jgi:hypothetical protein
MSVFMLYEISSSISGSFLTVLKTDPQKNLSRNQQTLPTQSYTYTCTKAYYLLII